MGTTGRVAVTHEQLRSVINAVSDYVVLQAVEPGPRFRYELANRAMLELLRAHEDDVVGRYVEDVVGPTYADLVADALRRLGQAGGPIHFEASVEIGGVRRDIAHTVTPIYDDSGDIIEMLWVARDHTDARRVVRELGHLEAQFRYAFERAPIGMAVIDLDGVIERANARLGELLATPTGELAGRQVSTLMDSADEPHGVESMQRLFAGTSDSEQITTRFCRRDQSAVPALLTIGLVRSGRGRPLHFIAHVQDMTEQLSAREALLHYAGELEAANAELRQAGTVKDEIIAVTSHELRTPLTSIIGFSSTLLERWDEISDEDKLDSLLRIARQGQRLHLLVQDLLTLSSFDTGALRLEVYSLHLRTAVDTLAAEQPFSWLGVEVEVPDDLVVLADPDRLAQMLGNYLSNAAKYAGLPVSLEAERVGDTVVVSVLDRGPGIPEEFVPRLFDRFTQGRMDAMRPRGGTGLGLAIVRMLATAQSGQAWFEPRPGGGSRFCVSLPAAPAG
jgi:PAS domain S-box-containing protein